jgi:hypothetical protein
MNFEQPQEDLNNEKLKTTNNQEIKSSIVENNDSNSEEKNKNLENQEKFILKIGNGKLNNLYEIEQEIELLNLSPDFINSPEVQEAAEKGFISDVNEGFIDRALQVKGALNLSPDFINSPEVQEAAEKGFIFLLNRGELKDAIAIRDEINLSPEIVKKVAQEEFIESLAGKFIDFAFEIKNKFDLSDEFISSPEVQKIAQEKSIEIK